MKVLRVLSSRTTRWKSARLHGRTMLQSLSAPLQSGLRFFQHPLPAIPSAFLADAPASTRRRDVGFAMFDCDDTDDLAPTITPAVLLSVGTIRAMVSLTASHFGQSLSASLARLYLRCLGSSLVLSMSSSLVSPTALTLAVAETASRQSPHLDDGERLSRQLPSRPLPVAPVPICGVAKNVVWRAKTPSCIAVFAVITPHIIWRMKVGTGRSSAKLRRYVQILIPFRSGARASHQQPVG